MSRIYRIACDAWRIDPRGCTIDTLSGIALVLFIAGMFHVPTLVAWANQ